MRGICFLTKRLFSRALFYAVGALCDSRFTQRCEVLARQRCYAVLIGILTDVSGQPVLSSSVKQSKKILGLLDAWNGIDRLTRNVDN